MVIIELDCLNIRLHIEKLNKELKWEEKIIFSEAVLWLFRTFQQEVSDILMYDAVTAHIKFVQRKNILGGVVTNVLVHAELALYGFGGGQDIADLYINLLGLAFGDEIDFFFAVLPYGDFIATALQFQKDNVFQYEVNILHIAANDGLPDAVVG